MGLSCLTVTLIQLICTQKDGQALPVERHSLSGGNLTIVNLLETDRGMYECSATNEAATITAEAELMIENIAPRPPYNLTANSTETCITISWQPGESEDLVGNPIANPLPAGYLRPNLEYTVWYRLSDAPEWRTLRVLDKTVMEATVQHLLPGREYEFMVLSQDRYGDGMFSKQFRFQTQGELKMSSTWNPTNPDSLQHRRCAGRTLMQSTYSTSRVCRLSAAWVLPGI